MGGKFVVVTGDFAEGLKDVFGIFETEEQAEMFAECHNLKPTKFTDIKFEM